MNLNTLYISLLAITLSSTAFSQVDKALIPTQEDKCHSIDLRNEYLGVNRDQGEISWCYAYTSSDLLAYHFKTDRISAADTAISYNNLNLPSLMKLVGDIFTNPRTNPRYDLPFQTGFSNLAISNKLKNGICFEKDFPSEQMVKVSIKNNIESSSIIRMEDAMMDIIELSKKIKSGAITKTNLPYYFRISNMSKNDFFSILKKSKRKTVWENLRKVACSNPQFEKEVAIGQVIRFSRIFSKINKQLNRDNIVAIDYSSKILKNANHRNPLSSLHTSSIVGRRFNKTNNQCEYLIRDSHGTDCSQYDQTWSCEAGNIWIDEASLYPNLLRAVYIK